MSLNMLIEFGDACDYTGADFRAWAVKWDSGASTSSLWQDRRAVAVAYK